MNAHNKTATEIDEAPTKVTEPKAEKKTDEKDGEELKTEPEGGGAPKAEKQVEAKAEEKPAPPASGQPETAPAPSGQSAAPVHEGPVKASPLAKKIATSA